ncbi:4-hydroxybenzoate 3-monooxygenase [Rhodococcus fascians]|uniref:4-hydroxybenzoate 3-monooxygenase n=1 Tax=Rhodococcoides fascians TaxID=1828 RepID=UPI0019617A45|nr:4-hydroxybenzoate 3-monooxygenase [Rhodococcus fascians]MBM7244430.1 4-hydroxybenzoate 3-monooxygenase [Rhodococcus fascians]MBY3808044.1 4-hydroxybenzoate 3-monooxygenase [Rhodococcus fascians]MBY3839592.1 4-hydroxybenzoate 3-monooxygenase [Rhodococcus fascians]MBY3847855.1 4-hydroxybenzoate 3-monooxygenase [Rhodococcus fascians]MBY3851353.1 4-hydroxybenzoate 3-monooxygenase [Rhodococcus fascians]
MRTRVGIVGAGPAGLMLSHLLHLRGIDSVVLESRSRSEVEGTIRAGVLEQNTVDLMVETGIGDRVKAEGLTHSGVELRFAGRGRRIDFEELTGRSVTVYPQHEVLKDLIARRLGDDGDVRFEVSDVTVHDHLSDTPTISFVDKDGSEQLISCDLVAGCDGSRTGTRFLIPETQVRTDHFRQYPFAWFGILAEAPQTSEELIYAHHERGFALCSTRTADVQRHYLQVDPEDTVDEWSDDRIWDELHKRVDGEGAEVREGTIFSKSVLQFRSFVCEPLQHGRLFLAGDSAHTVPPTGAKGMNLAIADVFVLSNAMATYFETRDDRGLASYSETVLPRIWRAQHFSYWMTSMLHTVPGATSFDLQRQIAELDTVTRSTAGRTLIAENYVGVAFG